MHQVIVHIILIALIFGLFVLAATYKSNSRDVKQQVLEKQLALLIDSAVPETTITVKKAYMNGGITDLEIKEGRIFVYVDNQGYSKGYPYFTKYNVNLELDSENYYLKIIE